MSAVQETGTDQEYEQIQKPQASSSKTRKVYVLGVAFVAVLLLFTSINIMISATSPNIPTVIEPGSMVSTADYVIFPSGANYHAKNSLTGAIDFNGIDAGVVIQNAIDAISSNGLIQFTTGIFNISGFQTGNPYYYSIGFRSGHAGTITLQGTGSIPPYHTPVSSGGTVLNFTTAVYAALPNPQDYSAVFSCPPSNTLNKPVVMVKDLTIRLPNNQRQYTYALNLGYGLEAYIENVVCDFEVMPDRSVSSTVGIILPTGPYNGATQVARNCHVIGFKQGFILGDFAFVENCEARNCYFPFSIGGIGSWVQHMVTIDHSIQASCNAGIIIGGMVSPNLFVTITNYDDERGSNLHPWERIVNSVETLPGVAGGFISYTSIDANEPTNCTYFPFWEAGSGLNFTTIWGGKYNAKDTSGIITVTGAVNYVDVSHNLGATPTWVLVTGNNSGIGWYVVTAKNSSVFAIEFQNQPGTNTWTFYWNAKVL